jgi:hypothetical protein
LIQAILRHRKTVTGICGLNPKFPMRSRLNPSEIHTSVSLRYGFHESDISIVPGVFVWC